MSFSTPTQSTPTSRPCARLLIVEDQLIMQTALRVWLSTEPGLSVLGEAECYASALELAAQTRPDIILLDLELQDGCVADRIPNLLQAAPGARIIILTGATNVAMHRQAFRQGALGLVRKDQAPKVLLQAIEHVCNGGVWIDSSLMLDVGATSEPASDANATASRRGGRDIIGVASLTPREREIITLVAQGLKNKQLARQLSLSERTVHNHLASIFRKLNVGDRLELVLYAQRHDLLAA